MTKSVRLEVCVDTVEGLKIVVENSVDRVELCSSLSVGGLTPSAGMIRLAAGMPGPVRVMVRPREGDFTYSESELTMMLQDIDMVATYGLDGVVLGANLQTGELDEIALVRLTTHAKSLGLKVTLHRSFDMAPDLMKALAVAQRLQVDSILTSGGAQTAIGGADAIAQLVKALADDDGGYPIELMAGVGVNATTAKDIVQRSGVDWVHGSCSREREMTSSEAVRLGYSLPEHRRTDASSISRLRTVLRDLAYENIIAQ